MTCTTAPEQLLASFVWTERDELLCEYEAARAWTASLLEGSPSPVVTALLARQLDAMTLPFVTPAFLAHTDAAGQQHLSADFGRCFVWNYPVHRRLAEKIESQYGTTSLLLSPSAAANVGGYESSARPVKAEPGASPTEHRADTTPPSGQASGDASASGARDEARSGAEDEPVATGSTSVASKKRRAVSDDEEKDGEDDPGKKGPASSKADSAKKKKVVASTSAAGQKGTTGEKGTGGQKGTGTGRKAPSDGAAVGERTGDNEGDHDDEDAPEDGPGTPDTARRLDPAGLDASAAAVDSAALMHALRFIAGHAASLSGSNLDSVLAWDVEWRPDMQISQALYKRSLFAYIPRDGIPRDDGTNVDCDTIMWDTPPDLSEIDPDSINEGKDPEFSVASPCKQPDLAELTAPALGVLAALTTVLSLPNSPDDTLSELARTPSPRILPSLPETEAEAVKCLKTAFAHARSADGDTGIRARLGAMQDGEPFQLPARLRRLQQLPPECFTEWGSAVRAMLKIQSRLSAM